MFFNKDIRYYFDVSNTYVLKKLLIVLCPFMAPGEWTKTSQEHHPDHLGFLPAKFEIHAPDLYIPLMGFMTFIILACLSYGEA
jgi:hypothetical protein